MNSAIAPYVSPEELELAHRRQELALLQAELTDRELFLADLQAQLASFEVRYLREVGVLYAELDHWNAKIAEFAAEMAETDDAEAAAQSARARAEESHAGAHGEASKAPDTLPSPELRKLYREVVIQVHPDRPGDDADRALRAQLMVEANLAYERRDIDGLRRILDEYKRSPESVTRFARRGNVQKRIIQSCITRPWRTRGCSPTTLP